MKCKVERIIVEKKYFQVEFEGLNGGTWVSVTERSRGFVVSIGFDMEELVWLMEHLKKAVEVEASRGFEAILSMQEYSERDGGASKEKNGDIRMNRDTFRGGRSYAEVVAEAGLRTGGTLSAGKWARAVICESQEKVQDWTHEGRAIARMMGMKGMVSINPISAFKGCFFVSSTRRTERVHEQGRLSVKGRTILLRKWSPKENMVVQGKFRRGWLVAKETLKLVDLTRAKLWVEMLPNVVLPALLEVEDGEWSYTVAVSVTGEDEDADAVTSEINRSRNEWVRVGGCVSQSSKAAEGLRGSVRDIECYRKRRLPPGTLSAIKDVCPSSPPVCIGFVLSPQRAASSTKAIATLCPDGARAGAEVFFGEEGRAVELKAQFLPNPRPLSDNTVGCKFKGPSGLGQNLGGTKPSGMEVWSRREEIKARKGKAPAVHMRDATQEEETAISKKMWSTLFPLSVDRRQGHRCCRNRVNPLSRCPLSGNLSKEDTSASRVEVKGGLTGRVGLILVAIQSWVHLLNSINRGKGLIFEGFCEVPGAKNLEVCQPSSSQPPESPSFPSCSPDSPLMNPSGPILPNSVPLPQSPTENQGISKKICEKGGVDYLNHGDIPDRVEEENQCALSNQMTESYNPKDSIVRSHKEVSGDFLIDGLSPGKMAKVREYYALLTLRCILGGRAEAPQGIETCWFWLGRLGSLCFPMKIISWNVRGLGSRNKRRMVKDFLRSENPDVVMIQETKRRIVIEVCG
ncbi:hypothetical protein CK203_103735 [Vitis vinifera]|uniref:DUF4283 domain-containing protein n=1 Tax=Vitis vinifera TaxID=29760 RepID=A0A438D4C7_VITVI|nr:hypothetical protein CK203_103735 [Vitis vinifera]